jgi:hypothetical protein
MYLHTYVVVDLPRIAIKLTYIFTFMGWMLRSIISVFRSFRKKLFFGGHECYFNAKLTNIIAFFLGKKIFFKSLCTLHVCSKSIKNCFATYEKVKKNTFEFESTDQGISTYIHTYIHTCMYP